MADDDQGSILQPVDHDPWYGRDPGFSGRGPVAVDNRPAPSADDTAFAQKNQWAYGQPWDDYFNNAMVRILASRQQNGEIVPRAGSFSGGLLSPKGNVAFPQTLFSSQQRTPIETVDLTTPEAQKIKQQLMDVHARAALMANRDPIAWLGFEPSHTAIDLLSGRGASLGVGGGTVMGVFDPIDDEVYANTIDDPANVIVHESIHRGLERLQQLRADDFKRSAPEPQNAFRGPNDPPDYQHMRVGRELSGRDNELMVRHIMATIMGDPDRAVIDRLGPQVATGTVKLSREAAEQYSAPYYRERLQRLRDLAADEIARKRLGGPR